MFLTLGSKQACLDSCVYLLSFYFDLCKFSVDLTKNSTLHHTAQFTKNTTKHTSTRNNSSFQRHERFLQHTYIESNFTEISSSPLALFSLSTPELTGCNFVLLLTEKPSFTYGNEHVKCEHAWHATLLHPLI